ncbi:MAG: M20/M25/M40 family metallo-hydrolase [Armatimonadetes bacterium]|nr:M20/M25/M40 family metallo-hydrolase [Armatimonadota bacterium]
MRRFLAVLLLPTIAFAGQAAPDPMITKIIAEGKNNNQTMKHLWWLTQKIGARLTGSPRLTKAEHWGVEMFTKFGLKNVHLEEWGQAPVGFDRGEHSYGRLVGPEKREFEVTTDAWMNGTSGPVRGPAIPAPTTMEEYERAKDKLKGAWLVYPNPVYSARIHGGEPADVAKLIDEAGIAGRVFGSSNESVHTDGRWRKNTYEHHEGAVSVLVRKSDMKAIQQDFTAGKTPVLEFNLENIWSPGPVPVHNVVAEIPGTEKPDEVVIVSGHLDSWNGYGSQGAQDNGVGTCTALEAARILSAVHAKPKRTIRFILWTGEEQGLFGSVAYCKQHKDEMPKISAVLVDDGGTNYQGGYTGPEIYKSMFESAYAPVVAAFPDMPEQYKVVKSIRRQEGGSDHAPFWVYDVPSFFTIETGKSNYGLVHHTQMDRLETCVPAYLVQSSTNHAVVAYTIANLPNLLPRPSTAEPKKN